MIGDIIIVGVLGGLGASTEMFFFHPGLNNVTEKQLGDFVVGGIIIVGLLGGSGASMEMFFFRPGQNNATEK